MPDLPPLASGAAQPPIKVPGTEGSAVTIDNRTVLPDEVVREAVMAHWVESASLQFGQPTSFQLYATQGTNSMLNRSPFRVPLNVIDEIKLARDVADTDDDVRASMGQMIATGFGEGMQNQHADEKTTLLFNKICGPVSSGGLNMDRLLKELYREYLISASITTISLFTRTRYTVRPPGNGSSDITSQLATPLVGVIPAEQIRVLSNDIFGNGELGYLPTEQKLKDWLEEFFAKNTTPGRKNQMAEEEPILAALFTGRRQISSDDMDMFSAGVTVYTLNQRMVHRTTMPKGASAYPRPLLTANFALLEAKRLLNIMDYALLQGGTNYIVIARQGSDQLPAQQPEIDNLMDQVRTASRTGVLVGDHRLNIEIITPDLTSLLNKDKRMLVGRKLAMLLLRIPEQVTHDAGNAGAEQEMEFTSRTISSDRRDIKRHVEGYVYEEIVSRNPSTFTKGAPSLWFPKIVLTGVKDFYASVLQARDRGDIPRRWAVEILGFDYEAGLAEREREKQRGDDDILTPGPTPTGGVNSNPDGRPPGSSSDNGRPGAPPGVAPGQEQRRLPVAVASESILTTWDEEQGRTIRYGEMTSALLEAYPEHSVGRVQDIERRAIESEEAQRGGPAFIVPVNPGYDVVALRAFRLDEGLSVIVGQRRDDGALVARALSFREPQFDLDTAEELALRWGFVTSTYRREAEEAAAPRPSAAMELFAQLQERPEMVAAFATAFATAIGGLVPDITVNVPAPALAPPPEPPAPTE